jgi:hypothetical protein
LGSEAEASQVPDLLGLHRETLFQRRKKQVISFWPISPFLLQKNPAFISSYSEIRERKADFLVTVF